MSSVLGLVIALAISQPPAAAPASARLSGRVTAEGTNAPLADARVILLPTAPQRMAQPPQRPFGPPPQSITDQDGHFAFGSLRPGEYRIEVQRTGYAPLGVEGRGRTITLAAGQSVDNVELQMQKGAVISGRILSPSGEPQSDVQVTAMRRMPAPPTAATAMSPRLMPAPMQGMPPQTNDLGEFRIAGLAPGEYYVAASPRPQMMFGGPGVTPPSPTASRTTIATTFYPGTTDAAAAQPIQVARGAEVGNISFTLQALPAFRVSGVVVDEEGTPVADAMVMLMRDMRSGSFVPGPGSNGRSGPNGRFTITNVVAGTYRANASVPMMMNSGGVVSWSSSGGSGTGVTTTTTTTSTGGATVTSAGARTMEPVEVVVSDADVPGIRIVVRRPQ